MRYPTQLSPNPYATRSGLGGTGAAVGVTFFGSGANGGGCDSITGAADGGGPSCGWIGGGEIAGGGGTTGVVVRYVGGAYCPVD